VNRTCNTKSGWLSVGLHYVHTSLNVYLEAFEEGGEIQTALPGVRSANPSY
jgi:hypothetical protein